MGPQLGPPGQLRYTEFMRFLLLTSCLLLGTLGCAGKDESHAPQIGEECEGSTFCKDPGGGLGTGLGGVSGGNAGNGGQGGTAGSDEPDAGTEGALVGTIDVISSEVPGADLTQATALDFGAVEVSSPGSVMTRVSVDVQGESDFVLPEVAVSARLWVALRQLDGSATQNLITTLQPVDSTRMAEHGLFIADRTSLEDLAAVGSLSAPADLDVSKGHALLHFVSRDTDPPTPIQGISMVSNSSVTGAIIAYDAGVAFTDSTTATDLGGSVLILNMGAQVFPGGTKRLVYEREGVESPLELEVSRDALTVVTVAVD